jgi:hypothetical protein
LTLLGAVHRWGNWVLLVGVAGSVVAALVFAAIPARAAVGTYVEVERVPAPPSGLEQEIIDARAAKILFVERTPFDAAPETAQLKVKYRSSGEVVPVPSPPASQIPRSAYLTDHGVIYVATQSDYPYARVWEWRDGTLIDHGGVVSSSFAVKGDWAIWSSGSFLYRRDLALGQTILLAEDAGNTENDVASNGTVAYWTYDGTYDTNKRIYSVRRFRHGHTEQLTPADPTFWYTYPLTDGSNVVYRKTNHCCFNEQGSMAVSYDPGGEVELDSFRTESWPWRGRDYDIAGGWVAYTRIGPSGERFQVRVRDPDGGDSALSPAGMPARIADVSLEGEVMFYSQNGGGHLYLAKPGSELIDFSPGPPGGSGGLFRFAGNWYESAGGGLYRLDVVGRPAITSGPFGATAMTSAAFGFTAPGPSPEFECRLDGGEFSSCPSPRNYSDLGDGEHRFEVKITGAADPTPAQRIWTVDSTPPADFALRQPGGGTTVNRDPVLSWDATSDATTGFEYYEIVLDGSKIGELDRTACRTATCSFDLPNSLPDGVHTWRVRALDAVGNVRESETRSFTVADPPAVAFSVTPLLALTGEEVSFDASGSSDPNGTIVRFQWDLDGDGTFERDTGADPRTTETYADRLDAVVKVRVTDSGGLSTEAGQPLIVTRVSAAGRPGISINGGAVTTNDRDVQLNLRWPSRAINAVISNDGGFQAPGVVPVDTPLQWRLESSGPQLLPKTVYVRFEGGESGRETYTDDIILDETRPTIQSATATPLGSSGSASASKARARRYRVRIRARDTVTGIKGLQVTNNRRRPGKLRKVRKARAFGGSIVFKSRGRRIYVRAQDGAANFSRWRKARITR